MVYGSIQQVRAITGLSITDIPDSDVTQLLNESDSIIEKTTGRVWRPIRTFEMQDGNGRDPYTVTKRFPVLHINSMIDINGANKYLQQGVDYFIYPREGRIAISNLVNIPQQWIWNPPITTGVFAFGNQNIRIDYYYMDGEPIYIVQETANGTVNGVNKVFTIDNLPLAGAYQFAIYVNGTQVSYTSIEPLTGTITLTDAPPLLSIVTVDYNYLIIPQLVVELSNRYAALMALTAKQSSLEIGGLRDYTLGELSVRNGIPSQTIKDLMTQINAAFDYLGRRTQVEAVRW